VIHTTTRSTSKNKPKHQKRLKLLHSCSAYVCTKILQELYIHNLCRLSKHRIKKGLSRLYFNWWRSWPIFLYPGLVWSNTRLLRHTSSTWYTSLLYTSNFSL